MMHCQKKLFSINENVHYFNCAYKAPLLKQAEKAAVDALIRERNPYTLTVNDFFDVTDNIKSEFSTIISCHKDNIALMPSTSYGFASVLNSIKANSKKAITIENEFPSGYFALKKWCELNNNNLKVINRNNDDAETWNKNIIEEINEQTAIVLLSSVHWMNGTKLSLKEIGDKCKKVGAYFIVDGTQSVGAIPINVSDNNIDALICASYKWLFGPYSSALGYFSENFKDGMPIEESWMNRTNAKQFSELTDYDMNYAPMAGRFNVGQTSNFVLNPVLLTGLKQINQWGVKNIYDYCHSLSSYFKLQCESMNITFEDSNYSSPHLFSVGLPNEVNVSELKNKLEKKNIYVSLRGDYLRVSLNVFNDKNDVEQLANALKSIL